MRSNRRVDKETDMIEKRASIMEFPCEFPIKVLGRSAADFHDTVIDIIKDHVPNLSRHAVKTTSSRNGNYVSITVLLMASSREQLDGIYQDLSDCEAVIMAL